MPIPPLKIFTPHVIRGKRSGRPFGGPDSKEPRRRRSMRRVFSYLLIVVFALFCAGSIGAIALFAWAANDLPDPNNISQRNVPQTTKIYDRKGETLLYEIHGAQKRTVVELADIAKHAIDATITAEDRDFYTHKGFDLRGILRAFKNNLFRGDGKLQGGSTITQQFIKKTVFTDEQRYIRKVKELILSIEIERRFTKDEILKLYLNEIPYGSVAYGIESASETFFGKKAKDLSLSESALLASLPRGPTYYSPYGNHRDDLAARQRYILDGMAELGYVTAEEAEAAKNDDVIARIKPRSEPILAPHFVFYVKEALANELGEQALESGGLKIITTLDMEKQTIAEEAIVARREEIRKKWDADNAALLAIEPKTGDIVAMVGSADYWNDESDGKVNALLRPRQPGSSIKPVVYAAAFEKGYTPDTVLYDVQTRFKHYPEDYEPSNYDGTVHGPVTMREALAGSLNIPAVKTMYLVGTEPFVAFAKRFGYSTFDDMRKVGLSIALGSNEVRGIEHIAAFGVFANDGKFHPTNAVLRVEDADGKILIDAEADRPPAKSVIEPEIARQVNSIMTDNAARAYVFGERNFLTLADRPVAAKTGTTNDNKDAWAVGFTPSLVSGVWVGNMSGKVMKKGADGSKVAAPIWNEFMAKSLARTAVDPFAAPQPVVTGKAVLDGEKNARARVRVDRITGKLATENTPSALVEERAFGTPHSILFFVAKDDPRGPQPADPSADEQFANWESGIAAWAEEQHIISTPVPTEYDDVHVPENVPAITFSRPENGATIPERTFFADVYASARRGVSRIEYALDDEVIATARAYPFNAQISIPNRFVRGFHMLKATAFDDVENSASVAVTINLTAEPGPLDLTWQSPWSYQTISASREFPFLVRFKLEDMKSVEKIDVFSRNGATGAYDAIGSIANPVLPSVAVEWVSATPGRYSLVVQATLVGGETRSRDMTVDVVP